MKISRPTLAFVAIVTLTAVAAICGTTILPPEMLAGAGMIPFAMSGNTTLEDIKDLVDQMGGTWKKRMDKLEADQKAWDDAYLAAQRPGGGASVVDNSALPKQTWYDAKSGKPVPVLERTQSMAALAEKSEAPAALGRFLRGVALGSRAHDAKQLEEERKALGGSSDTGGGYLMPHPISSTFIDLVRAKQVLIQAGARTVPMENKTLTLARLIEDPAIAWHQENASLDDTEPTFGAVTLEARTVVCLVRLSLELAQDAANIESILADAMVKAMAGAIDSAGINGQGANHGVITLPNRNTVTSIGAPTSWDFLVDGMYELMLDNVDQASIGALVAHPAVWKKMRKLKTGITSDNTPLSAPDEVAKLPKLWTTAAPLSGGAATGIIGDWRDLLMGVRKDINVMVLQQAFMGTNLQVGVLAYARVDFAAARQQSFCTLEGITV